MFLVVFWLVNTHHPNITTFASRQQSLTKFRSSRHHCDFKEIRSNIVPVFCHFSLFYILYCFLPNRLFPKVVSKKLNLVCNNNLNPFFSLDYYCCSNTVGGLLDIGRTRNWTKEPTTLDKSVIPFFIVSLCFIFYISFLPHNFFDILYQRSIPLLVTTVAILSLAWGYIFALTLFFAYWYL